MFWHSPGLCQHRAVPPQDTLCSPQPPAQSGPSSPAPAQVATSLGAAVQELQGLCSHPRSPSSSYPSLGNPHYCSNSPLQAKGTCSARSHSSPPCGSGNRSAGKPGEGRGAQSWAQPLATAGPALSPGVTAAGAVPAQLSQPCWALQLLKPLVGNAGSSAPLTQQTAHFSILLGFIEGIFELPKGSTGVLFHHSHGSALQALKKGWFYTLRAGISKSFSTKSRPMADV